MSEPIPRPVRLVVLSSYGLAREALSDRVAGHPDFVLVGQADGWHFLRDLCARHRVNAVLVEVDVLCPRSAAAIHEFRAAFPLIEVVVAYSSLSPEVAAGALDPDAATLTASSRGVDAVLELVRERVQSVRDWPPNDLSLTDRESAVLSLMTTGIRVHEIAALLHISARTVESYKRSIYLKLGVSNQGQAVSRAISLGIVHRPSRLPATSSGVETDQPALLVVGGAPGPCRDEVMRELIAHRLPYVFAPMAQFNRDEHWARWHPGPLMAVLADPTPADWLIPRAFGIISIVVQSAPPCPAAIADALRHGARSLIWRQDLTKDLLAVVPLVARGYLAVASGPLDGIPSLVAVRGTWELSVLPELSVREQEILHHVALGHTIQQSARALGIAAKTVENTRTRLFRKLGARNRSDAVLIASRLGLVDLAFQTQESVS